MQLAGELQIKRGEKHVWVSEYHQLKTVVSVLFLYSSFNMKTKCKKKSEENIKMGN